jgi:endonuclease/exonuclease/phosphatase family metal-dependent hydrolase
MASIFEQQTYSTGCSESGNQASLEGKIMPKHLSLLIAILLCLSCSESNKSIEKHQVLRVLSYNIHHGEGMDGKIDIERIANVISKENPDLVALQEVDKFCTRSGDRDMAAELGKLLGMEHIFGKAMDFQEGEYGLAVLSKLPIKEKNLHRLPKGDEPRCALEVKVKIGNYPKQVSFICIHNSWNSEGIRIKQIKELLKFLDEHDHPVVLAGDFNAKRKSESMMLLQHADWKILSFQSKKMSVSAVPDSQIDFFVIRNFPHSSVESRVIEETIASDHSPIFAEIVF